ncbi:hypothetical protein [Thalassospira marina]|uniref:Uncharacterized protein n=1 Tax=Thalassospira marina TaxID=2048283 RepID=A0A2N3KSJ7_9PROT|nr:hypothetical protein [Thalassospira marina]PKR53538.1 hypothetical protein COO20_13440 [Thalassospira marina]
MAKSNNFLSKHGTVFDCGPVRSNAKSDTLPGQFYFGGTAPIECQASSCVHCKFYRPNKGKTEKKSGLTKPAKDGVCLKTLQASGRPAISFEGAKALPCKYFETITTNTKH